MSENDPLSITQDIQRIRQKAEAIKSLAGSMEHYEKAIRQMDLARKANVLPVRAVDIIGAQQSNGTVTITFLPMDSSDEAKKLQARMEDALRDFCVERIRKLYDQVQQVKDEM